MQPRGLVPVALVLAALLACTPAVERREASRTPAPDGVLDAVVVTTDAGATTALGVFVHVVARGAPAERDGHVLRVVGPCCDAAGHPGVAVRWSGPRELTVAYREARFADPATPELSAAVTAEAPTVVRIRVQGPSR